MVLSVSLVTKKVKLVKLVCIILPQISGYTKYFENSGKDMSLVIKDDDAIDKYNEIWDKIKNKLNIKFHSMSVYDEKYIKAKVQEFNVVIKTNFLITNKYQKKYQIKACIALALPV